MVHANIVCYRVAVHDGQTQHQGEGVTLGTAGRPGWFGWFHEAMLQGANDVGAWRM